MSRPLKRRRLNTSSLSHTFLDLEAQVENISEEEEEEENVQDLIDDTELDDDAPGVYSLPMKAMAGLDEGQDDTLPEDPVAEHQGHFYDEVYWQKFRESRQYTNKYMQRIAGIFEASHDDERRPPELGDSLWEIGCKTGAEEDVVFEIGARFMEAPNPAVRSVIGRKTLPGRIYVEAVSELEVFTLARTVDHLNSAKIRRLGCLELLPVLIEPKPVYRSQTWRRILGPWKEYKGDIALVVEIQEEDVKHLFMAAVPRLHLHEGKCVTGRPPRKLFKLEDLEDFLGHQVISDKYRAFQYKGRDYMPEGYLVEHVHKARLSDEVVPSLDELNSFKECLWLEPQTYQRTALLISQLNIKPHDRVKVVAGDFINLVGQVVEISENEVELYLPSQDANERIILEYIRPHFVIGDEVKLLGKDYEGVTAWVVGVDAGEVRVVNLDMNLEITILPEEAEFYDSPHSSTLRIRKPAASTTIEPATIDPHRKYVGRHVMATGSVTSKHKHTYKGYVGIIKNTAPDGSAWVELQALQQKVVKFDLDDLRLWIPDEKQMDPIPISTSKHFLNMSIGPSGFAELPDGFASTQRPRPSSAGEPPQRNPYLATPVPVVGTPMPSSCSADETMSPAWDPSSQTPRASAVEWLRDPLVAKARIKLVEGDGNGATLEFQELRGDLARVREGPSLKMMHISTLRAMLPMKKDELVIPTTGEMRGLLFKIRQYGEDICVARQPGKRLNKGDVDPSFATVDLVQVFPPLNRQSKF